MMRHNSKLRSLWLAPIVIIAGTVLFASHAWMQQSPPEKPVWDVQLASNAQATSNITIQNQCQQPHTFTVTEQQTPYLQLLAAPTVNVPGNNSFDLPVRFNTNGMNAGQYQGTVVVKCETCRKEKTCKQDRELLRVRLTVVPESAPQTTPQDPTQPQIPGPPSADAGAKHPPIIGGPGGTVATTSVKGYDPEKDKEIAAREFSDDQNPCKKQDCPAVQKKMDKGRATGDIYCPAKDKCGGKDCPTSSCRMFFAWKDAKTYKDKNPNGTDKEPEKWKLMDGGVGENKAITPDKGQLVYSCGCR